MSASDGDQGTIIFRTDGAYAFQWSAEGWPPPEWLAHMLDSYTPRLLVERFRFFGWSLALSEENQLSLVNALGKAHALNEQTLPGDHEHIHAKLAAVRAELLNPTTPGPCRLSLQDLVRLFPRPAPDADPIAWATVDQDVYDDLRRRGLLR
jgi:hypothetical protein